MKLPKRINLGLGNVVKVEEVPRALVTDAFPDADAVWAVSVDPNSPYVGAILIDKNLPFKRKRHLLYHELIHAINDLYHWERDRGGS